MYTFLFEEKKFFKYATSYLLTVKCLCIKRTYCISINLKHFLVPARWPLLQLRLHTDTLDCGFLLLCTICQLLSSQTITNQVFYRPSSDTDMILFRFVCGAGFNTFSKTVAKTLSHVSVSAVLRIVHHQFNLITDSTTVVPFLIDGANKLCIPTKS